MNTTNPNYEWLSRKPHSHTPSRGRVVGINPISSRNGADAPCPWCPRALNVNFVIKQRVARPRHLGRAAAQSPQTFIWTIYRCEAMDVSFPMALETSQLDLCSSFMVKLVTRGQD
ncbi:hypothetical protein PIB30_096509 [Stylosanthes scabra]|uniref:Uncharacterized protein n=1 Tax=Stylosanthes scabra TaxID=79078 RepID=A0ABU6QXG1_9FABA|nr:hypothetical protein [Stylosanthes scabra]